MASPMPVLPLVASMTVCPGLSCPDCSAASMTPSARRSFTDPRGLKASILTKRLILAGASLLIFTIGVLPTVSRMLRNLAIGPPLRCASLAHNASASNGNRRSRDPAYSGTCGGYPIALALEFHTVKKKELGGPPNAEAGNLGQRRAGQCSTSAIPASDLVFLA